MDLEEWTIQFVKHRDLFKKSLESFEKSEGLITFKFKDKRVQYFLRDSLSEEIIPKIQKAAHKTIVCSYAENNIEFVIKNWEAISEQENLLIIFVNPLTGKKLLLNPKSHNAVADPESLELGIRTMFEAGKEG